MALRMNGRVNLGPAVRALWLGLPWLLCAQAPAALASAPTAQAEPAASAAPVLTPAALAPAGATATEIASRAATKCFDEAQWQALQRSTAQSAKQHAGKALLYVWSPRMVFSAVHAHEVQQEAQALGLRFVPVHDGRLPAEEVAQALAVLPQKLQKQQNLVPGSAALQSHLRPHPLQASVPLCAPSLVERDAYRHFPTAWVVQHGSFHPVPLVSAMPPRFWRMGLLERLQPQPELQRLQNPQALPGQAADKP